ncbi:hypothetical protein RN22_13760 [Grimontia sp. AD028]|nr:hypothetical protein RN22_13760 [Grimontia sp. AD028]
MGKEGCAKCFGKLEMMKTSPEYSYNHRERRGSGLVLFKVTQFLLCSAIEAAQAKTVRMKLV